MTIHQAGMDFKDLKLGDDIEFSGFEGKPQEPKIITGQGQNALVLNYGIIEKDGEIFTIEKRDFDKERVKIHLTKEELKAIIGWLI